MSRSILIILRFSSLICLLGSWYYFNNVEPKSECGTVTYKSTELNSHYKSTEVRRDRVLYVKFPNEERQVYVDIRTYETRSVGDKVCFKDDSTKKLLALVLLTNIFIFVVTLFVREIKNEEKYKS